MKKPILNPSRLKALAACWFKYFVLYVKNLAGPENFAYKREFGTYVHVAEGAHDMGDSPKEALELQTRAFKREGWYNVKLSGALKQLELEALKLHEGGEFKNAKGQGTKVESYRRWKTKNLKNAKVVEVELRLYADVGPVILAPKLDAVIESDGWTGASGVETWVHERKSTERWMDKTWEWRWTMDGQTTAQMLALEVEDGETPSGVMVEPIQITRQSRQDVPDPQPIGKAARLDLKWVRKPQRILDAYRDWLEDVAFELQMRHENNSWPKNGMDNGACDLCGFKKLCKGDISLDLLSPRTPDEVDTWRRPKTGKAS